ncbi:hypothetical protein [Chlorobium sp. N1]|uniref:hypothetical protein n=1 Tax=Chlorobium sp. N1 TaxID=2491138 RepID=UPI0013F16502|nr:hypothetical protein [Chlorobium sp. N1]
MLQSFKKLWNLTFLFVAPFWSILAWMIWDSGQLQTDPERTIYLLTVVPGLLFVYLSGFMIESWHRKKKAQSAR